jgi:curved DNA-binding protein CbpA
MNYFPDCYTPDELKLKYRNWAKKLHPDKGGSKKQFQEMTDEYEAVKSGIYSNENKKTMPEYFNRSGNYEYHHKPVKYEGIYFNHYYKFTQPFGAIILIDINNIKLIFEKRKAL